VGEWERKKISADLIGRRVGKDSKKKELLDNRG